MIPDAVYIVLGRLYARGGEIWALGCCGMPAMVCTEYFLALERSGAKEA